MTYPDFHDTPAMPLGQEPPPEDGQGLGYRIVRPRELLARRWPMAGGGTAYELLVPEEYAHGAHILTVHYDETGRRDPRRYVSLTDAILPPEHWRMSPGPDRWESFKAYESAAKVLQLEWSQEVFPELADCAEWPLLWEPRWTLPAQIWGWMAGHGWTPHIPQERRRHA